MVGKGEMLLCKEGNTKEEMTESLMGIREGRWPIRNRKSGKDTSVQGSGHTNGSKWESGACEGEEDTTPAQVQGEGAESREEGGESSCSTSGMCGT